MVAVNAIGWIGIEKVTDEGFRVMLAGEPIDPFFVLIAAIFAIVFSACALIGLCWMWVPQVLYFEQKKFADLHGEIVACRDELARSLDGEVSVGMSMQYVGRVVELNASLEKLKIPVPGGVPAPSQIKKSSEVVSSWLSFLINLSGHSKHGNLEGARSLEKNDR